MEMGMPTGHDDAFSAPSVHPSMFSGPTFPPSMGVSVGFPAMVHQQQRQAGNTQRGKHFGSSVVEIYDPDFHHVVTVSRDKILHTPHPNLGVSRLVLCRNFSAEVSGSCTKGDNCKFVHADMLGAKKHPIHVNYAWRSIDLVTYPRLPCGETLIVFAPNERPPSEEVPSDRVLITRGSLMRKEHAGPLSHCAHYYFNRMCNRGERCHFIHAIVLDPNAADLQRAPAPTTIAPLVKASKKATSLQQSSSLPADSSLTQPPNHGPLGAIPPHLLTGTNVVVPPSMTHFSSAPQLHSMSASSTASFMHMPSSLTSSVASLAQQCQNPYLPQPAAVPTNAQFGPMNHMGGGYPHPMPQHGMVPQAQAPPPGMLLFASNPHMLSAGPQSFSPPPPGAQVFYMTTPQSGPVAQQIVRQPINAGPWPQQHPGDLSNHSTLPQQQQHAIPKQQPSMTSLFASMQSGPLGPSMHSSPQGQSGSSTHQLDWSMVSGVYNNCSLSHSASFGSGIKTILVNGQQ